MTVWNSAIFGSSTGSTNEIAEIKWGKRTTSWYETVDNWKARLCVGRSTNRREYPPNFLDMKIRELQ